MQMGLAMQNQPSEQAQKVVFAPSYLSNYLNISLCRIKWAFFCNLQKQNTTLGTEDMSKNTTRCDLRSHGLFLQTLSQI